MITLYIDTHSENIEMAILNDGKLLKLIKDKPSTQHSSVIMPMLVSLLDSLSLNIKNISDIVVINGPGSFTGVRLGVTISKSLAYLLDVPIRVMSSLHIKAISNVQKGFHWFVEREKNGFYVGEFNEVDELLNDYIYIKKTEFAAFKENRNVIEEVQLNYEKIFEYSRNLQPLNPHIVNPLYVKQIEVKK